MNPTSKPCNPLKLFQVKEGFCDNTTAILSDLVRVGEARKGPVKLNSKAQPYSRAQDRI